MYFRVPCPLPTALVIAFGSLSLKSKMGDAMRYCVILVALTAIELCWAGAAIGQNLQPASETQASPLPRPSARLEPTAPAPDLPGAGVTYPRPIRSPSDDTHRPAGVSFRYDMLGRIIEIVRIPGQ